jgi:hypothetical protein
VNLILSYLGNLRSEKPMPFGIVLQLSRNLDCTCTLWSAIGLDLLNCQIPGSGIIVG